MNLETFYQKKKKWATKTSPRKVEKQKDLDSLSSQGFCKDLVFFFFFPWLKTIDVPDVSTQVHDSEIA